MLLLQLLRLVVQVQLLLLHLLLDPEFLRVRLNHELRNLVDLLVEQLLLLLGSLLGLHRHTAIGLHRLLGLRQFLLGLLRQPFLVLLLILLQYHLQLLRLAHRDRLAVLKVLDGRHPVGLPGR